MEQKSKGMSERVKPCPFCGSKMGLVTEYINGEHLYYLKCSVCSLYFGLSEEYELEGEVHGNYCNAETVALEWNALNEEKATPIPCASVNVVGNL